MTTTFPTAVRHGDAPLRHGLHITTLWRGDALSADVFVRGGPITLGPNGDILLPADAIGGERLVLAESDGRGGFTLCVDPARMRGRALIGPVLHSIGVASSAGVEAADDEGAIRADAGAILAPMVIQLTPSTHAALELGAFTLLVTLIPLPRRSLRQVMANDVLPMAISLAAASVLLWLPLLEPPRRQQAELRERAQAAQVRTYEVETVLPTTPPAPTPDQTSEADEPEPREALALVPLPPRPAPERPTPSSVRPRTDALADALEASVRALRELEGDARKQAVRAAVDEQVGAATAPLGEVLDNPDAFRPTLGVFDEAAGGDPDVAAPTGDREPGDPGLDASPAPRRPGLDDGLDHRDVVVEAPTTRTRVDVRLRTPPSQPIAVLKRSVPKATGELPPELVQREIRRRSGAIQRCYARALQNEPTLRGTLKLAFWIGPDGAVGALKVQQADESLRRVGVDACVQAEIAAIQFPPVAGGGSTQVVYPFRFEAR